MALTCVVAGAPDQVVGRMSVP